MYIVTNEITVTWVLAPTASPLTAGDYDIRVIPSDLEGTYTNSGIVNYFAPTADSPGSIQYLFTPNTPGRWKVYLTTGTALAYTVIDEKDFWVFTLSPVSVAGTKVLGALSYPQAAPFNTTTEAFLTWNLIHGIAQHPGSPELIYVVGRTLFGDANDSVAIINLSTGLVDTIYDKTLPFLGANGIAVNESGRMVVPKTAAEGSLYECYYSDNGASWVKCTRSGMNTTSAGQLNIEYDIDLGVYLWLTGVQLGISSDGITFYQQNFDLSGDDVTQTATSGFNFTRRQDLTGQSVLYAGSQSLGSSERMWTYLGVSPIGSLPAAWEGFNGFEDIFGAGHTGQKVVDVARDLDGSEVWMCTSAGLLLKSSGKTTFPIGGLVNVSGTITNPINYFFTIPDFGKMYIASIGGGTTQWYESTDGTSWSVSTDTRLSIYSLTATASFNRSYFLNYYDNTGVAFVHNNGSTFEVVVTV